MAGSFSAVSKRNFARKYAFDSIFQALQDAHTFAPLRSQNFSKNRFEKSAIFVKNQQFFFKCCKICKILNFANYSQKIQLENLVDFEKCCKTRIFLQRSVPIQPKTNEIMPKICQKLATALRGHGRGGVRLLKYIEPCRKNAPAFATVQEITTESCYLRNKRIYMNLHRNPQAKVSFFITKVNKIQP